MRPRSRAGSGATCRARPPGARRCGAAPPWPARRSRRGAPAGAPAGSPPGAPRCVHGLRRRGPAGGTAQRGAARRGAARRGAARGLISLAHIATARGGVKCRHGARLPKASPGAAVTLHGAPLSPATHRAGPPQRAEAAGSPSRTLHPASGRAASVCEVGVRPGCQIHGAAGGARAGGPPAWRNAAVPVGPRPRRRAAGAGPGCDAACLTAPTPSGRAGCGPRPRLAGSAARTRAPRPRWRRAADPGGPCPVPPRAAGPWPGAARRRRCAARRACCLRHCWRRPQGRGHARPPRR
jgi:hypothetical protein